MDPKPKSLRYASTLASVENAIVEALPDIVDGLIDRAREGDTKAAVYLIDRILGRTTGVKSAPADDRELPYDEDDFAADLDDREFNRSLHGKLCNRNGA
jgi:hypothetical protein